MTSSCVVKKPCGVALNGIKRHRLIKRSVFLPYINSFTNKRYQILLQSKIMCYLMSLLKQQFQKYVPCNVILYIRFNMVQRMMFRSREWYLYVSYATGVCGYADRIFTDFELSRQSNDPWANRIMSLLSICVIKTERSISVCLTLMHIGGLRICKLYVSPLKWSMMSQLSKPTVFIVFPEIIC